MYDISTLDKKVSLRYVIYTHVPGVSNCIHAYRGFP